ncbi:unnamed protein product [Timema podura]|uniref:Uncharacterized protein n=1 Tax=Timema podura TaxID=61482 RepID=A0ABN7NXC2_TIMPD|nr:unnamed protein product [Timema podura]
MLLCHLLLGTWNLLGKRLNLQRD